MWAGSVEMELHYKPDGECASPVNRGSGVKDAGSGAKETNGGGFPPLSPCSTSLASSFAKAALLFPEKGSKVGGGGAVQADLLALSPRVAKEAEAAALLTRSCGRGNGVGVGDGGGGIGDGEGVKCLDGGDVGKVVAAKGVGGGRRLGMWRSFLAGVVCSAVVLVCALWALGDPFAVARLGLNMDVLEDGGPGRQTLIVISGSVSGPGDQEEQLSSIVSNGRYFRGDKTRPVTSQVGF